MSRKKFTVKNIKYGYISNLVTLVLKFVSRTIFISILGVEYLGVNGLFINVLGALSMAELGIGVAMNYALYKPVAEKNIEKLKSLMRFYRNSYRVIALVVTILGFGLLPFFQYLIKDPGNLGDISVYYIIFLFNTVTSYLVSYKYSLLNAEQKGYLISNIQSLTTITTVAFQIIFLLIFKSFLAYLLIAAGVGVIQKIFVNRYINKKYPYLKDKNIRKLTKEEIKPIKKNTIALIWHKIGGISVYQTDNLIIAAFISVATVGIVSNYNLIITSVSGFITIIFNSAVGSFGNLIATEDKLKQYQIFKVYRFVAFWIYGFSSVAFFTLSTPFITLWIGENMIISEFTLLLIIISFYLSGDALCINNLKSAGGVFNQDKYVAVLQAVINLVVSIIMVRKIGLAGVFIGTIVQSIVASIIKPIIVYKAIFERSSKQYFVDWIKFAIPVIAATALCWALKNTLAKEVTVINLVINIAFVVAIPNILFYILFRKNTEFMYLKELILNRLKKQRVN